MSVQDIHAKFGIDEVYFHKGFHAVLLEKLHQRAVLSLDAEDNIVLKNVSHDMILIFHNRPPNQNLIYRFLEFLNRHIDKEDFIKSNTLLNEDELLSAIKTKNFVLVTYRMLSKGIHSTNMK